MTLDTSFKIESPEILEIWTKAIDALRKAQRYMIVSNMKRAEAEFWKNTFWEKVVDKHGINATTYAWTFDQDTSTVSRDTNPMREKGSIVFNPSMFGGGNKDESGVVI
jgi:hypothetical protein